MKTRHSKQVLVGLSVFSDGVLHFLQIKKKFYIFYRNYRVALRFEEESHTLSAFCKCRQITRLNYKWPCISVVHQLCSTSFVSCGQRSLSLSQPYPSPSKLARLGFCVINIWHFTIGVIYPPGHSCIIEKPPQGFITLCKKCDFWEWAPWSHSSVMFFWF